MDRSPPQKETGGRQRLEENCRADLTEALQLRALGNMKTILSHWEGSGIHCDHHFASAR